LVIYFTSFYTGSLLAAKVYQTIDEYDLKKKLFFIRADNVTNNVTIA